MPSAFDQLHPDVRRAVWDLKWDRLRPLQERAIEAVLNTKAPLVLGAATASGKTEAVFLPVITRLLEEPAQSIGVLYVSPLKALINDQYDRISSLCEHTDIPVHRWHGDVSPSEKKRLRTHPAGVLLITPESLESQFINYGVHQQRMYAQLRFVVIDEVHSFLDNVRGVHLLSLLSRLSRKAGCTPRRIGLSATIGDFAPAREFLSPRDPDAVLLIEDEAEVRPLRASFKAYLTPSPEDSPDEKEAQSTAPDLEEISESVARQFRDKTNLIFCNSRLHAEELSDCLRIIVERERWPHNPFLIHHGSLSREVREDTEEHLKEDARKTGRPCTAICTSTLEMGINLGAVESVGQVNPPWSVASLVQRVGRSGRGPGQPQVLRVYTLDSCLTETSVLEDRLFLELVRAVALLELHLENFLEPAQFNRYHFSTLVHQIFSVCREKGGASPQFLFESLCSGGAFRCVEQSQFVALLRNLKALQLIEQVPGGDVILAPKAEFIVNDYHFYAAFAGSVDYRVEHQGHFLGVLAKASLPVDEDYLLFAGRRWQIVEIDHPGKRLLVKPAQGWKKPFFEGGGGAIHWRVGRKMREVLADGKTYAYLNEIAANMLTEARAAFAKAGLDSSDVTPCADGIEWFPWSGTRELITLNLCAKAASLNPTPAPQSLLIPKVTLADLLAFCHDVADRKFSTKVLVDLVEHPGGERFDEFVPPDLLRTAMGAEVVDVEGAAHCARRVLRQHGLGA